MPYLTPLTHVRVEGVTGPTVAGAVEQWSFGLHYAGALLPAGYDAALPGVWDNAANLITASGTAAATFHPDTWLTEVMAAEKGADGRLVQGFYSRYSEPAVRGTGSPGSSLPVPYQTALVVTLDAGKPAPGRFGRFYLPVTDAGNLTGGLMSVAKATAYATAARDFALGVSAALGLGGPGETTLVAASERYGTNRPVVEVRVGRVPDTIRSRRTSLPEDYQTVTYPA